MSNYSRLLSCAALAAAATSSWAAAAVAPVPPPAPPAPVVLITAKALDGSGGMLDGARIGVSGGKIASLHAPAAGNEVDLRGYTVMPGWIDTHVHLELHFDKTGRIATEKDPPDEAALTMAAEAWATLQAGFTTIQERRRGQQRAAAR